MSQQEHSEGNLLPIPEPMIQQQVENSTLGGGMQAAIGKNIQIQNSNNVTVNNTEILQISVVEIKTRKFIETSPYKGLKKFEPEDKDLFFGRDQFLQGLVDELEQTNLVLLLGASGSGKSSVVRAGLVPWLFRKYGTQLVNLIFTPDQDPFESLYASLLSKNTQASAQIAREAKADTLTQVVTRLKQADDYWFILIDQFEELFTTSQSEKRDRFIASLVQLAKAKLPRVKIMATMRADFLDKLSPYPALVNATDKHCPMIGKINLAGFGYLYDPDTDFGRYLNPDLVTFDAIADIPCLALLGEPGIGKSSAINAEKEKIAAKIQKEGSKLLWLDLRACGSEERLIYKLFESTTFQAWIQSDYRLYVFLDSLDECLLRINTLAALLVDELSNYSNQLERLYFRIACRTADWRSSLEQGLKELWGKETVGVYELAPLRRADIASAAQAEGLDENAFLQAIEQQEVAPLAIKPITLKFLLNTYRKNG